MVIFAHPEFWEVAMESKEITEVYGNRVRVRVCGLLVQDDTLLMVNHKGVGPSEVFWAPPGGGLEFEETAIEAVQREFLEETGLAVVVKEFLFVNEFKSDSLHGVELFFTVDKIAGEIIKGSDPDLEMQIITEVAFMNMREIKSLPEASVHGLFRKCDSLSDVLGLNGYVIS